MNVTWADVQRGRLRLLRAAWRAGKALDPPHFAQVLAMAALNPDATGEQLSVLLEFEEPYRSQCAAALATCLKLPVHKLREIRKFDDPFRSQCLSALMGDGSIDVAKMRVVYAFADPFRTQCLALLSSGVRVDVEKFALVQAFDDPFRTRCLSILAADPSADAKALQAIGAIAEPYRTLCLGLAVTSGRVGETMTRSREALASAAPVPAPDTAAARAPEIDAKRAGEFGHHRPEVDGHADVFFRDLIGASEPAYDDERHLREALEWLLRSRDATGTAGFSAAYSLRHGWLPPYPETTGYIIPTFWDAYKELGDERYREAARRAADWEIEIQLESGAIQAGYLGADPQGFWNYDVPVPAAFNTGQVVLGWNRAYQESGDQKYLEAATRACRFLAQCVDDTGVFRQGLSPGPTNPTRSYYTRVAWAMAWTGRLSGDDGFEAAAVRHLDWVVQCQEADGWFPNASFQDDGKPLTHTMAYTAEGLLQAGLLLGVDRYVKASERHAVSAMNACERRGSFLPAFFTEGWKSTEPFSCLPGNAQFATLWLQHGHRLRDLLLANAGLKMVEWLKGRQALDNPEPGIRGGLPGAWPIDGGYSVFSIVNWAAKYFADALVEARRVRRDLLDG
jgi:hypothetical protein